MRTSARCRRPSQQSWVAPPQGPFGPVKIQALTAEELVHAESSTCQRARANDLPALSMTAFFAYLHDHEATTDLAKALANAAMLRTSGARTVSVFVSHERLAS